MLQEIQTIGGAELGGGLSTIPNLFNLKPNQTPHCMNVRFTIGGAIEKRFGSNTLNATVLVTSAATGFSPDTNASLGTNLLAAWNLDEQSGLRRDAFGANNLTDNNSVSFGSGVIGNGANFIGANSQYLSLANTSSLSFGAVDFTITGWFSLADTANRYGLISKGTDTDTSREYALHVLATGNPYFVHSADGSTEAGAVQSTIAMSANTYTFIACGHRAGVGNWISVNNATTSMTVNTTNPTPRTHQFWIGRDEALGTQYITGTADLITVHNKYLSPQERTDLFNSRLGNQYSPGVSASGFGAFDFGAGFGADGKPLRWLVVAAGTGIYASSNRGVTFVVIATDRGANYQYFERSKNLLIATSETMNKVLYWAGSVGTFMQALAVGSAPPAKHALDFQGFLFLMGDSSSLRLITYADNNTLTTNAWNNSFELPSSYDDGITDGIILNKRAYVFTKYKIFRVSYVGGNPDFGYQEVKGWGVIPGTIKKITLPNIGEVLIGLGWDKKLRIFDGAEDMIISDLIEQDNGISPFALSNLTVDSLLNAKAEVDTNEQVYKILLAVSPSAQTTTLLNYNYRLGAFYPYDNHPFNAMVMADSGASRILIGVGRAGYIHQMGTGFLDGNSSPVVDYYQSPFLYRETPRHVQKGAKIDLYFSPTSAGSVYYQDRLNFTNNFGTARQVVSFANTAGVTQLVQTIDIPVTMNVYQFQLSSSGSTAAPWRLNRYDYYSADKGVGKA